MNALWQSIDLLLGKRPVSLQVGAICFDAKSRNILLITSRGTGRWVIPKGWPMEGRNLCEAAAIEAWEEAGVRGQIREQEIGRYSYDKYQESGFSIPVEVRVFMLEVDRQAEKFPESAARKRRWFSPDEAAKLVAEPGLKKLLMKLPHSPDKGQRR